MFQLAIQDTVEVPVKFTLKQGSVDRMFKVTLTCARLSQDDINTRLEAAQYKFKDFMQGPLYPDAPEKGDLVTSWRDQRLVLDEQGQPAPFSAEAFAIFLSPTGVAQVVYQAYQKECGAKEKN